MVEQEKSPSTGQLIGIAAGASGALAAGLVAVSRARSNNGSVSANGADVEHGLTRARHGAVEIAGGAREIAGVATRRGRELASSGTETAREVVGSARPTVDRGRERARATVGRVRSIETPDPETARKAAKKRFGKLNKQARRLAKEQAREGRKVRERTKKQTRRVEERAVSAAHSAQSLASQAAATTLAGAERAKESGATVIGTVRERVPDVAQQLSHRAAEDVAPTLRDIAVQAAATAIELWHTTKERAAEAAETARGELLPQAEQAVGTGTDRAKEATVAVGERVEHASERAKLASDKARDASRRAVGATVDTSKDTGATLFWAGAAAGLIFYALMSEERREQLTRSASMVLDQVQELIKDFQGYDDEF